MQRSTLNCNVPLTGYSRTYRYAFIHVYIYIYIFTLAEKSFEIFLDISSSKGLKEGFRAGPAHARTHSHVKHASARVRRCGPQEAPLRSVGPPRVPLVSRTRWQLTVCDGQRGTVIDAHVRFYARWISFFCA